MAKTTNGERIAVLETKMTVLISRVEEQIRHQRNGKLLKLRELGIWISLVAILLRLFGAV